MPAFFQKKLPPALVPWVRLFGSLKLAVVLLVTISLACAVATVFESRFDAKVARYYIYDSPWFTLWLLVLCLNLFCAALTRWPWKRRHLGFVVTHAGIILMLAGAMIGRWKGYEGILTLEKGEAPVNQLVIDESVLLVESPVSGEYFRTPLPVEVRRPGKDSPRFFPVPGSTLKLRVDGYSETLGVRRHLEAAAPDEAASPGILLEMSSAMMGQKLEIPLLLEPATAAESDLFGRAHIKWMEKLPPVAQKDGKAAPPATYRETQMLFARFPQSPVWHNTSGRPSGYAFLLEEGEGGRFTLVMHTPAGEARRLPLEDVRDKPFRPAEGVEVHVVGFWNDLKMVEGKPVNASDRPDNPAVLVTLSGLLEPEQDAVVPELLLALGPDAGSVAYRTLRHGAPEKSGLLEEGESLSPGWADWSIRFVKYVPRAVLASGVEEEAAGGGMPAGLVTGIHAALTDAEGRTGEARWIVSGTTQLLRLDARLVRVGFGLEVKRLDFGIGLDNFEVPRDEGTETPANFISTVRFYGGGGVTGPERIEMNTPASYPPGWWGALTGLNHKFSQAGWDPENLDRTTLQVLHDPGWFFKWSGSILICGGILMLFYLKPAKGGRRGSVETPAGKGKVDRS